MCSHLVRESRADGLYCGDCQERLVKFDGESAQYADVAQMREWQARTVPLVQEDNAKLRETILELQSKLAVSEANAAVMRRAILAWDTIGTDVDNYTHDEIELIVADVQRSVQIGAGAELLEHLAAVEQENAINGWVAELNFQEWQKAERRIERLESLLPNF